jgi:hypothetical protein
MHHDQGKPLKQDDHGNEEHQCSSCITMEIRDFLSTTRFTKKENKGSIFLSKRKHTIDLSIHKTNYMNMKKENPNPKNLRQPLRGVP